MALANNAGLRKEVQDIIEMPYKGTVEVKNILQVLMELGPDKIAAACSRKMTGLRIASYYGCLLVRPPKVVQFDDPEAPQSMDTIIKALGGTPVEWGFKTECCGGGFSMSRTDMVCKMTRDILDNAAFEGAEAFAVACPMCQSNLDLRQLNVNQRYGTAFKLPALYITQWIGLCMGLPARDLGLGGNYVDTGDAVAKAFAVPPEKKPPALSAAGAAVKA
jgi:heterodisulfide reductase subunit B